MSEPRTPEQAAAEAARRARGRIADGEYGEAARLEALEEPAGSGLDRLEEWTLIDVDPSVARSTRRAGAPITAFKRLLLRLLLQYHNEQAAQMARFNLHLLGELRSIHARMREFERRLDGLERAGRK